VDLVSTYNNDVEMMVVFTVSGVSKTGEAEEIVKDRGRTKTAYAAHMWHLLRN